MNTKWQEALAVHSSSSEVSQPLDEGILVGDLLHHGSGERQLWGLILFRLHLCEVHEMKVAKLPARDTILQDVHPLKWAIT